MDCIFGSLNKGDPCTICGRPLPRDYATPPHRTCDQPAAVYVTYLEPEHYLWQCRRCNWTLDAATDEPVEHVCGRAEVVRLGDRIAQSLAAVGVTEDRWLQVKQAIGLPQTCKCEARKQWLNKLDEQLQLGERLTAFMQAINWKD